jgi:hypothetical protein
MEAIALLLIVIAGLLVMGVLAIHAGTDSRDSIGDDHVRPTAF